MEYEYEVTSKAAFIAAVKAACFPTYEVARANPVVIKNGSTTYRFKEGIHEERARELINNIKHTPQGVFNVN